MENKTDDFILISLNPEKMAKQPEGKPKDDKSKATKTLKEKRADKAAKKESKKNY